MKVHVDVCANISMRGKDQQHMCSSIPGTPFIQARDTHLTPGTLTHLRRLQNAATPSALFSFRKRHNITRDLGFVLDSSRPGDLPKGAVTLKDLADIAQRTAKDEAKQRLAAQQDGQGKDASSSDVSSDSSSGSSSGEEGEWV